MSRKKSTAKEPTAKAATASSTTRKPRGVMKERSRRRGVKNRKYEMSEAVPSRCGKCKSTQRIPYFKKIELDRQTTPDGQPCTHQVMRYTQCCDCKQHRIDISFEYRPAEPVALKAA